VPADPIFTQFANCQPLHRRALLPAAITTEPPGANADLSLASIKAHFSLHGGEPKTGLGVSTLQNMTCFNWPQILTNPMSW